MVVQVCLNDECKCIRDAFSSILGFVQHNFLHIFLSDALKGP